MELDKNQNAEGVSATENIMKSRATVVIDRTTPELITAYEESRKASEGEAASEAQSDAVAEPSKGAGDAEKKEEPEEKKESFFKGILKEVLVAAVLAAVILQFIKPTIIKQRSMEPNFYANDYVLVSKQSYRLLGGKPALGDVIVFHSELITEEGAEKLLIKRVIGVAGDVISIKDGKVYLNGDELDDSYTKDAYTAGSLENYVVPEGYLFCLGDNRAVSVDSRASEVGAVAVEDIVGKVVFRLFPLDEFGTIENPYE